MLDDVYQLVFGSWGRGLPSFLFHIPTYLRKAEELSMVCSCLGLFLSELSRVPSPGAD